MSGERSGRSFRLGDSVEVKVMRVDLDERKIDFEIAQTDGGKVAPGRAGAGAGKAGRKGSGAKAAAGGADVQKSREVKKALLADSKGAGKTAPARGGKKPADAPRGAAPSGKAPAGSGKPRKRKPKAKPKP